MVRAVGPHAPHEPAVVRVGFQVKKRLGTAVERNRLKRRLKAACEDAVGVLQGSWDIVVIALEPAVTQRYNQLAGDLRAAFERLQESALAQ